MLKFTHPIIDVAIVCSNFDESLHFYRDQLGLEVHADLQIPRSLIALSLVMFVLAVVVAQVDGGTWGVFAYTADDGHTYVSTEIPSDPTRVSDVRHFFMSGGYLPRMLAVPNRVDDLEQWQREYRGKGFSFVEQQ